ncbi:MAG: acyltransferase [Pseudomonadales bacterium]|nr:acyltransferase [Pseudomonadales bacterium]MCP5184174.1 acyltransferase [Pseudomonadales bacterium]
MLRRHGDGWTFVKEVAAYIPRQKSLRVLNFRAPGCSRLVTFEWPDSRRRATELSMQYREEIDGLRALAVIPVVFFHAGFSGFAGGYVGVDVFFVISGYLITSLLLADCDDQRFSIMRFYERRARRILPALLAVILLCIPVAWLVMVPDALVEFGHSVVAVITFVSNVLFWTENSYFGDAAEVKPLLHTWSLAVEEQYYLLFPVVVLLLHRLARHHLTAVLVVTVVAGLTLAEYGWHRWPHDVFFLTPFRAWELLAGSAVGAFLWQRRSLPAGNVWLSLLGLGLIAAAIGLYDSTTPFPGIYGLAPVAGTCLLILFATGNHGVVRLLRSRPLVQVGLLSYSLYLWHQPLFAFARLLDVHPPSLVVYLALIVLSFLLAWLSWRFVEAPFRNRARVSTRLLVVSLGTASLLALGAGVGMHVAKGAPGRFDADAADVLVSREERYQFLLGEYFNYDKLAAFANDGRPKVLLIGDSFSGDFLNVIRSATELSGLDLVARQVVVDCQFYVGPEAGDRSTDPLPDVCGASRRIDPLLIRGADVIIVAHKWAPWALMHLGRTLDTALAGSKASVWVMGAKSFGYFNRTALAHMSPVERRGLQQPSPEEIGALNALGQKLPARYRYLDMQAAICSGGTCPLFDAGGDLLTYDGNHLTRSGARFVAERLRPRLREMLGHTMVTEQTGGVVPDRLKVSAQGNTAEGNAEGNDEAVAGKGAGT